jgi:hypothetical protein
MLLSVRAFAAEAPWVDDAADDVVEDADASAAFVLDPLATACGVFGAEGDVVVHRSLAVGIRASAYRSAGRTWGAGQASLLVYPLRPVFHALYIDVGGGYARPLDRGAGAGAGGGVFARALAGWQWTWDYGLSIRLAAGAAISSGTYAALTPAVSVGRWGLLADAGLGWAW